MEVIKKKIEKYFGADYLLEERKTFGKKTKTTRTEVIDQMLRTIKVSENIFNLKDELPQQAYNKEDIKKLTYDISK